MKTFPDEQSNTHIDRLNDPKRLAALMAADVLDTSPEDAFDRVARLASKLTGAPVALVSFVDGRRQFFKAQHGLSGDVSMARETPLTHSFCQYVVASDETLSVRDARKHPVLSTNGAVPDLGVVAYLGVPVHGPKGEPLGAFCAIDTQPRDWTDGDRATLVDLSGVLESELAFRHLLRERDLLLQEMNHRVKNVFSIVSGIVRLSRREHASAGELALAIESRIKALAQAHEFIVPAVSSGAVDAAPQVSLQKLIAMLLEPHIDATTGHVTIDGALLVLGSQATTYLALVVHELATNAAKYGVFSEAGGQLAVSWEKTEDELSIHWIETSAVSRIDAKPAEGFGTRLIKISIEGQLRGRIERKLTSDRLHLTFRIPADALKD